MLRKSQNILAGILILLGSLTISCSKQDPTTELKAAKISQNSQDDLVNEMAADPLVQEAVRADFAYGQEYVAWFAELSNEDRDKVKADQATATSNGELVPDPSHTASQQAAYFQNMEERDRQIVAKYPTLFQLEEAAYSEAVARIVGLIESQNPEVPSGACSSGYRSCIWTCSFYTGSTYVRCKDACWAGFIACLNASVPIRA